jgi:choline dehydrogenase-like flavoprotein
MKFDYVVVGGGSEGNVVAGELAQDPAAKVLVLERGELAPESGPHRAVETGALVRRILFDGEKRAIAVEWEKDGLVHTAQVGRDVILCAGPLETPKLLKLSGVGPAEELAQHKIPLIADVPSVGCNLVAPPSVQLLWTGKHREHASVEDGVIRIQPGTVLPELIYGRRVPALMHGAAERAFALKPAGWLVKHTYGIVVTLTAPTSRGTVRLRSSDARDRPLLEPNFFEAPEDLGAMVAGVKQARELAGADAAKGWGNVELLPGRWAALEDWIRRNATSLKVTGPRLQVREVAGVRVAETPPVRASKTAQRTRSMKTQPPGALT